MHEGARGPSGVPRVGSRVFFHVGEQCCHTAWEACAGARAPTLFNVEAFALLVKALIAKDRFTQAHDLLKKNTEQLALSDGLYGPPSTSISVC